MAIFYPVRPSENQLHFRLSTLRLVFLPSPKLRNHLLGPGENIITNIRQRMRVTYSKSILKILSNNSQLF
jgi:hypothetical protein